MGGIPKQILSVTSNERHDRRDTTATGIPVFGEVVGCAIPGVIHPIWLDVLSIMPVTKTLLGEPSITLVRDHGGSEAWKLIF